MSEASKRRERQKWAIEKPKFDASSNENNQMVRRQCTSMGETWTWKIPTWQPDESQNKKEVIAEARNECKTVHFASLMDLCHLKNSELEPQHQKYKGRVVFRGGVVRGDSGSYAVFTEQGSSASQMTAAKVMDIISRLPACAGQAADAISAYTPVKMEDVPSLLKIPKSECPDTWIRLPKQKRKNHGPVWKIQSFLMKGICSVILWQDNCGKGNLR